MLAIGSPISRNRTSTACTDLLSELQQVWLDIGETEAEKDGLLLELERECLELYRRKVDEAASTRARLHHSVAAKEAELATLVAALGEHDIQLPQVKSEKKAKSLREQLALVSRLVEDLNQKKEERMKQFEEVKAQIEKITSEISGCRHFVNVVSILNSEEVDFSLRNLKGYQSCLCALQKEKSECLERVLKHVNEVHILCAVLGLDFCKTVSDIHPSLHETHHEQSTNISDSALTGLEQLLLRLQNERKVRFQKLKDVVASLLELWNLMDSTEEEKDNFSKIISVINSSESVIEEAGALSMEAIQQVSKEVEKLTRRKADRMKELVMQKRSELEDMCRKAHIQPDQSTATEKTDALIDSGIVDACEILANVEAQISKVKCETASRKEIMDRIERWLSACDEENWLEEYNQDESRYSAGRGAHINLKRAERARISVNKIPAMVDSLIRKTLAWEEEKKKLFLYDGGHLVLILEEYMLSRKQKEEEKKRYRDQKRLQDILLKEKEAIFGSKPSPRRSNSFRSANGHRTPGNGSLPPTPPRKSVGSPTAEFLTPHSYSGRQHGYFKETRRMSTTSLNFVAISKEDTMSFSSICTSEQCSPPHG